MSVIASIIVLDLCSGSYVDVTCRAVVIQISIKLAWKNEGHFHQLTLKGQVSLQACFSTSCHGSNQAKETTLAS